MLQSRFGSYRSTSLAGVVLLLVVAKSAFAGTPIFDLGTLGGSASHGDAINSNGEVVGDSIADNRDDEAFFFIGTPGGDGEMLSLGDLGAKSSVAVAISGLSIVGSSAIHTGDVHAIFYQYYPGSPGSAPPIADHLIDLGTLGGANSYATGISSNGYIVGHSNNSNGDDHAFLFTGTPGSSTPMQDLDTLGGTTSEASGISGLNLVGSSTTSAGDTHAFLYKIFPGSPGSAPPDDNHMIDLGTLGGTTSRATAINGSSNIVGHSTNAAGNDHAFLYLGTPGAGGSMSDLGTLGGTFSQANAINAGSQIVGQSITSTGATHAFLYSHYTGSPGSAPINFNHMLDLNDLLLASDPTDAAHWTLVDATGISDAGMITGYGLYNNGSSLVTRAFYLDLSALAPEPSSLSLLALGTLCVLRRPHSTRRGGRA